MNALLIVCETQAVALTVIAAGPTFMFCTGRWKITNPARKPATQTDSGQVTGTVPLPAATSA
jgi:hypothetical protein